jgi:hypothetical protein
VCHADPARGIPQRRDDVLLTDQLIEDCHEAGSKVSIAAPRA